MSRPPVIIIGMHRSGTSMLTRALQGLGFFMGRGTTRNEECPFTNALNEWVLRQASSTWERPDGVDTLLDEASVRELVVDYLSGVVAGPASWRYLGLRRTLRYHSMPAISEPWGWKDPRNTYTLPLWLSIFPEARVLHIMRHGVDVAQSLWVRRRRAAERAAARYRRRRPLYVNNPAAPKRTGFAHSAVCADRARGLALWERYTARARSHVAALGEAQALELRYEALLAEPRAWLGRISGFCGLNASAAAVEREAAKLDGGRSEAFRSDADLLALAADNEQLLQRHGYTA